MRVIFTGGGTAGHVLPNIAVVSELRANASNFESAPGSHKGLEILYIGSTRGPERALCERYDVPFVAISTGKFRRYFSLKNLVDPFRVVAGMWQAWRLLKRWKPDVVLSKGGFVSVPVVLAAARLGVPVVMHEADVEPGLANRICARFAKVICVSWEETMKFFDASVAAKKVLWVGMPVRREVLTGVRARGLKFLKFDDLKPVLLVMGGSLGAKSLNSLVWRCLEKLVSTYNVVHLTGNSAGGSAGVGGEEILLKNLQKRIQGYRAYPYLQDELFDVYAASDVVVSRAGASAIAELCVLAKPTVFIPLGSSASRGDQITNATVLHEAGAAEMLLQGEFSDKEFAGLLLDLAKHEKRRDSLSDRMRTYGQKFRRAAGQVAEVVMGAAN